ncbi:MAG: glutamate racemase [Pseudomonadota bacterium]
MSITPQTKASRNEPIGVFDSGVGGLSVLSHIRKLLPAEDLIYVADSDHLPYGDKGADYVRERSVAITEFLIRQGAKAIVVACNTATAAAVSTLRHAFKLPIIGMEPGLKPGITQSRNGKIAILATEGTLGSEKFQGLMNRHGNGATVLIQPCPGWVELVEQQYPSHENPQTIINEQLSPLLERGVDTLVLGCTHYPFLIADIEKTVSGQAAIIDTGLAVAKQLKKRLAAEGLLNEPRHSGREQFWSSASGGKTERLISRLWGSSCKVKPLPKH